MTLTVLTSLGMVLEHARLLLEHEDGAEAESLRHDVRNVLSGIRWLEADTEVERWTEHADEVARRGRGLVDLVRGFADERGLRFLRVDTPCPERSDTIVMSAEEIRAAIDAMDASANAPPPAVLSVLIDAQLAEERPSIPPAAPTGRLPEE